MTEPSVSSAPSAAEVEASASEVSPPVPWYRWPIHQIRRLYRWTLSWAATPWAMPALFVLAFAEASFFPIPPDVLLLAMALAKPKRSLLYAGICTAGSVAGAVLGWGIGASLWASLGTAAECPEYGGGAFLFHYVPSFGCEVFEVVQHRFEGNAWMAIFTAAFTPIPFKVLTVAAGVFHIGLLTLLTASAVGRSMRFFGVAALVYFFGPQVRGFIEERFELLTLAFGVLLIGGFILIKFVL